MYLPETTQNDVNREYYTEFKGYNHNLRISENEFYDMRNMTADNYPVMSSRDRRKCVLNIASQEYEEVEPVIQVNFVEESLSLQYGQYVLDIPVLAENEYQVTYSVNAEYVGRTEVVRQYRDADGNGLGEALEDQFVTPEGCVSVHMEIRAYRGDGVTEWNAENVGNYVNGFQVRRHNETIRGMLLKNGKLAYLIGKTLYWGDKTWDYSKFTSGDAEAQLISFGAYILAFPDGLYLNTQDETDYGYLGAECVCGNNGEKITYSVCDINGADFDYTKEDTAPANPEDGQYWMKSSGDGDALYQWSDTMAMWVAVSTTYIKIKVENTTTFPDMFEQYDSVYLSGASEESLNAIHVIEKKGKETNYGYILVTGILKQTVTETKPITFCRKIPELDYVCVSNNRVWGCHYGKSGNEGCVNEIYACKLGDPKNWYNYMGTAQDSYTLSMGDDGEFTGAYTYQGYPLFFKENNIYKIYGTYPAAYQLVTYDCRGLQKGSGKSLAIVEEYLVYKSTNDICVFDGNYPRSLSAKLGKRIFTSAAAGAFMGKYYISMKDEDGQAAVYVYDFSTNIWVKDESLDIEEFIGTKDGELYGRTKVQIIGFGNSNDGLGLKRTEADERVEWYVESGILGQGTPNQRRVSRIAVRASIALNAELKLSVSYHDEDRWNDIKRERGIETGDGKVRTYLFPIIPVRSDGMRIRLSGIGSVNIYSVTFLTEEGGDV